MRIAFCLLVAFGASTPSVVIGQQPQPIRLRAADATLPQQFTAITSVRELEDGRVLIADLKEFRLTVADFTSGSTSDIGRRGEGPGEYSGIGWVAPLEGDSTLVTDNISRRWLILSGSEAVQTIGASEPLPYMLGPMIAGADASGRILGVAPLGVVRRTSVDTLMLLLGRLGESTIDTIGLLDGYGAAGTIVRRGGRGGVVSVHPLYTEEQAVLFNDGWIAVARLEPYRVDWRAPDGRWTYGPPL